MLKHKSSSVAEKSFYQVHEMSYEEYRQNIAAQQKVEEQRERDYNRASRIVEKMLRKKG